LIDQIDQVEEAASGALADARAFPTDNRQNRLSR
jgi:hypothetical protein